MTFDFIHFVKVEIQMQIFRPSSKISLICLQSVKVKAEQLCSNSTHGTVKAVGS